MKLLTERAKSSLEFDQKYRIVGHVIVPEPSSSWHSQIIHFIYEAHEIGLPVVILAEQKKDNDLANAFLKAATALKNTTIALMKFEEPRIYRDIRNQNNRFSRKQRYKINRFF